MVYPSNHTHNCACGRTLRKFAHVEGRIADVVRLKDGSKISPYRLTCSLEKLDALNGYQIIQDRHDHFTIRIEVDQPLLHDMEEMIRSAIYPILGKDISIRIEKTNKKLAQAGQKFRIVESRI
jgi:phenylacetate-coenzyme A ligase PaaK-like adenylate-forming protein